jgi:hypothetical protein
VAVTAANIQIIEVEIDAPDGIIVTFSDGTVGAYVAEELLELRPHRELAEDAGRWNDLQPDDRSTYPHVSHPVQSAVRNGKTRDGGSTKFFAAIGLPYGTQTSIISCPTKDRSFHATPGSPTPWTGGAPRSADTVRGAKVCAEAAILY